ncbi:MAG TPA: SDR family oxidoreductase [Candidatus Saccharimonadaceae bacterium]|nr:SDR family oxidoreductase [Candidatus Saccharimonadaceae bacterium]
MTKTVIITGTSRGLGLATANYFAQRDWHVIGTSRSPRASELDQAVDYHQLDGSDHDAVKTLWQSLKLPTGDICLVNNAGGYAGGKLLKTQLDDYETQLRINYLTAVYMTREFIAHVKTARIINVISAAALNTHADDGAYGASKTAEMRFFHSLQKEYAHTQYCITNLYPSAIATYGPGDGAIKPDDLAEFIHYQATTPSSYYLADVTMYAR